MDRSQNDEQHTSRVKNRRPYPRVYTHKREVEVVPFQRVHLRNPPLQLPQPSHMHHQIHNREQRRRRLLYAREPPERPFTVVLVDFGFGALSRVGDAVHAVVPAVVGACPTR